MIHLSRYYVTRKKHKLFDYFFVKKRNKILVQYLLISLYKYNYFSIVLFSVRTLFGITGFNLFVALIVYENSYDNNSELLKTTLALRENGEKLPPYLVNR